MDPASAIGVASAVLTFLDFSIKIVRGAVRIYSEVESDTEWQDPEDVAHRMDGFARRLRPPPGFGATSDEQDIAELADSCLTLAKQLALLFQSLQPKDRKSKRQCLWAAAKAKLKESEVTDLEKRLDDCRAQLQLHLLHSDYLNGQKMKATLQSLASTQNDNSDKLRALHTSTESLKKAVAQIASDIENPILGKRAMAQLRSVVNLQEEALDAVAVSRILRGISFDGMNARYEHIDDAHVDTFRWILEDEEHQLQPSQLAAKHLFNTWLCSGTEVLHVSGKLGSGKSTMMKFLLDHPQTQESLSTWAGNSRLVFASFFFWRPGTKQQKSLSGLYRSLLHGSLKAMPSLVLQVLPRFWQEARIAPWQVNHDMEISDKEVRSALKTLVSIDIRQFDYSCCFFIDGLDEYEESAREDHRDVVDLICSWARSPARNVKFCVSSREYNVYMNAFSDELRIRIHNLTKHDMKAYATERLSQISWSPSFPKMVESICDKAEGIFLWVTLVVRELRYQLDNGAAPEDLEKQLDYLPEELEDLYLYILNELLRPEERLMAFRTFDLLALTGEYHTDLLLWEHYFLADYISNPVFCSADSVQPILDDISIKARLESANKRLITWCRGLVDVTAEETSTSATDHPVTRKPDRAPYLTYVHRSFPDFLFGEKMRGITKNALANFDRVDAFSQLLLAGLWAVGRNPQTNSTLHNHLTKVIYMRTDTKMEDDEAPPFTFIRKLDDLASAWAPRLLPGREAAPTHVCIIDSKGYTIRIAAYPFEGRRASLHGIYSSPALLLLHCDRTHPYIMWKLDHASDLEWELGLGVLLVYSVMAKLEDQLMLETQTLPGYNNLCSILAHNNIKGRLITNYMVPRSPLDLTSIENDGEYPVWAYIVIRWAEESVIRPWLQRESFAAYADFVLDTAFSKHYGTLMDVFMRSEDFDGCLEATCTIEEQKGIYAKIEFWVGKSKIRHQHLIGLQRVPTGSNPTCGDNDNEPEGTVLPAEHWDLRGLIEEFDSPNKQALLRLLESKT